MHNNTWMLIFFVYKLTCVLVFLVEVWFISKLIIELRQCNVVSLDTLELSFIAWIPVLSFIETFYYSELCSCFTCSPELVFLLTLWVQTKTQISVHVHLNKLVPKITHFKTSINVYEWLWRACNRVASCPQALGEVTGFWQDKNLHLFQIDAVVNCSMPAHRGRCFTRWKTNKNGQPVFRCGQVDCHYQDGAV